MPYYKNLFSHRKQLQVTPSELFKDQLTPEMVNAICNCYDSFWRSLGELSFRGSATINQENVEKELWVHFLNEKNIDFREGYGYQSTTFIVLNETKKDYTWYQKLDMVEYTIKYVAELAKRFNSNHIKYALDSFVAHLNYEFKRLDSAYRIVNNEIVEVNSEEEIRSLTQVVSDSKDNVREHLNKALAHYAEKPVPDVRNSIKESISAVEAVCRELTGEQTLGKALNKLEGNGIEIHQMIKDSLTKLYVYTNDASTGIRHALMDSSGKYVPEKEEAYYMLITCSAFINYLRMKVASK